MEEEVYQDVRLGKCRADRGRCRLERHIPKRRSKHMGSRALRRVEQREYRGQVVPRMSGVGVREYRQNREDRGREQ